MSMYRCPVTLPGKTGVTARVSFFASSGKRKWKAIMLMARFYYNWPEFGDRKMGDLSPASIFPG
jgi:hypothetical protein